MRLKLVVSCIFSMLYLGCSGGSKDVNFISMYYFYGDGKSLYCIGSSSGNIDSFCNKQKLEYDMDIGRSQKFVLSPKAIQYIAQYIDRECINEKQGLNDVDYYEVKRYHLSASTSKEDECAYYNEKKVKSYFDGMIKWINKSEYKSECKQLISQLQTFVNNSK